MLLRWTCITPGHHQSHCGRYSIERMRPEFMNPHPWTVTGPDGWGRETGSLASAKDLCQEEEHRLFPPPGAKQATPFKQLGAEELAIGLERRKREEANRAEQLAEEKARFNKQVADGQAQINARLGIKSPPPSKLKGGLERVAPRSKPR